MHILVWQHISITYNSLRNGQAYALQEEIKE